MDSSPSTRRDSRQGQDAGLTNTSAIPLATYTYSSLDDPSQEIRLLELLPGNPEDEIYIRIRHTVLAEPFAFQDARLSLLELRETIPAGWLVRKTLGNRYLFSFEKDGEWEHSWQHPDPAFDTSKYILSPLVYADFPDEKYEALSYVWGSTEMTQSVVVVPDEVPGTGGSHNRRGSSAAASRLAVTENLKQALLHLREQDFPRTLWVDAICFNQNDTVEVCQQIPRMRDIYCSAFRVVVWLGAARADTDVAIASLRHLANQIEVGQMGVSLVRSPDATEATWWRSEFRLPWDSFAWRAISGLLESPWFGRLWVTQEVQLARERPQPILRCGPHALEFLQLQKALCRLWSGCSAEEPDLIQPELVERAWAQLQPQSTATLRTLVRKAGFRDCLDPRDRVYGILGLASKSFARAIDVSYAKTAAEVYKEAFLAHARLSGRLELFDRSELHDQVRNTRSSLGGDAPSWVPDWSSRDWRAGVPVYDQYAAGSSRAHFRFDKHASPGVLQILGVRCATVNLVTEPLLLEDHPDVWDAARHVRTWMPGDLATAVYESTGDTKARAYNVTLIQGGARDRHPHQKLWVSLQDWKKHEWDQALSGVRVLEDETAEADGVSDQEVAMALRGVYGRMYFQTAEGYIGQGPFDVQVGDVVVVVLGCKNPLVLRPVKNADGTEDGDLRFQVIGECFVHGLQDSLKFLGPIPHPWRSVENFHGSRNYLEFVNTDTGDITLDDPRLAETPLDENFERVWLEMNRDNQHEPNDCCWFRHKETGDEISFDPRLEPEHLTARGVHLDWLSLV